VKNESGVYSDALRPANNYCASGQPLLLLRLSSRSPCRRKGSRPLIGRRGPTESGTCFRFSPLRCGSRLQPRHIASKRRSFLSADFSPSFSGRSVLQSLPAMSLRKSDLQLLIVSCGLIAAVYVGINGPWTLRHIVGLALIALGYSGWLTARLQIREFFTARAEARGLVTTGIYSKIRNPIYVFGLPLFAGVLLYLAQPWWWLLFLVPLILLQLWRARNEARVLDAKFGDAYRQYRSKTWF